MDTINLTRSQKNASQDAMRSLEEIKESMSSEQYRLLCKGLQVPYTIKKKNINTEVWRCQVFQSVLAGFTDKGQGERRSIIELDADSCIDYDKSDNKKLFMPVPNIDNYRPSTMYKKIFLERKSIPMDDGTHIRIVEKIAESFDDSIAEIETIMD